MTTRPQRRGCRRLGRTVVPAWLAGIVVLSSACTDSAASGMPSAQGGPSAPSAQGSQSAPSAQGRQSAPSAAAAAPPRSLRVLQANLCNSGEARCYTGRSVPQLAGVIRAETPAVVTLDEICEDDVAALGQVLDAVAPDDAVVSAFRAARDRPTDADYTCIRNGRRYGIGVLARVPGPDAEHTSRSGEYPVQDPADPEERVWVCLDVPDRFVACATHLANTVPSVALAQCEHLMSTVLPEPRTSSTTRPTVVAGDFNLMVGGSPDVRSCLSAGLSRTDDAAAQHIVTNATITASRSIDLAGTTDHPALLADLGQR